MSDPESEATGEAVLAGLQTRTGEEPPDGAWTQLLVEWLEEQTALVIGELEREQDS